MIGGLAGRAREALRVVGTWGRIARGLCRTAMRGFKRGETRHSLPPAV